MSWSAVAAVAELLGALAVLASLLYLANQIRQNTAVARSAARLGQYQSGMLSPDEWQGFFENLRLFFETELFNRYWAVDRRMFSPVFRDLVEAIRTELEDSGSLGAAGTSHLMRSGGADA